MLPPGFKDQIPLQNNWDKPLREVVEIDPGRIPPELATEAGKERHKIYCYLLMKLIVRFWNGNKRGPLGSYPWRAKQTEPASPLQPTMRYRGDMIDNPDRARDQLGPLSRPQHRLRRGRRQRRDHRLRLQPQ